MPHRRFSHRVLHRHPPFTPVGVLARSPYPIAFLATTFVLLALAAALDGGSILLRWDEPIQKAVEGWRESGRTDLVLMISNLGGTRFVIFGSVALLAIVWRRCHSLAIVLAAATLARPLVEWTLKNLVDRERPDLVRLVDGTGPSFPSGHVMAAIALWGLVPPVVSLLTGRRRWWWASVGISAVVIAAVAFARVYLGVHWFSDVVGALVLGGIYLVLVETLLEWHHRRTPCRSLDLAAGLEEPSTG